MGNTGPDKLRQFFDEIETLEDEKAAIGKDIQAKYAEAAALGFDTSIMKACMKERKVSPMARRVKRAMIDAYLAITGHLGTELSDDARRRMLPQDDPDAMPLHAPDVAEDAEQGELVDGSVPQADIDEARLQGRTAALNGNTITENPFNSGDPRRAAWDEGWCQAAGSDGMDPPAWLKRKPKPEKEKKGKKKKKKKDAAADAAETDQDGDEPEPEPDDGKDEEQ